jgi:excisionase family DNA binding protein
MCPIVVACLSGATVTPSNKRRYFTVGEVATLLMVSRKTVHEWIRLGKIKYFRVTPGGEYRIPRAPFFASLEGNYDFAEELAELDQTPAEEPDDDRPAEVDRE